MITDANPAPTAPPGLEAVIRPGIIDVTVAVRAIGDAVIRLALMRDGQGLRAEPSGDGE